MSLWCSQEGEQRINLGWQQSASEDGKISSVLVGNTSFSSFVLFNIFLIKVKGNMRSNPTEDKTWEHFNFTWVIRWKQTGCSPRKSVANMFSSRSIPFTAKHDVPVDSLCCITWSLKFIAHSEMPVKNLALAYGFNLMLGWRVCVLARSI